WRYGQTMRTRYPAVQVDEASLYHMHNRIFTSAGSAAGIDLMIEIVRQDYGPDAANSVARRIVMPAHRNGGQAQFLERPVAIRPNSEIGPVLDRVRKEIKQPWSIALMAKQAAMSRRTFERHFIAATGQGPGDWLAAERVEAAKDLLIRTQQPMDDIAAAVGFSSAHALRHHFRTRVALSPTEYRREFSEK
ncbi:helix-turn-helix domain-containing protein, partial [Novosphingobium umbonatum]